MGIFFSQSSNGSYSLVLVLNTALLVFIFSDMMLKSNFVCGYTFKRAFRKVEILFYVFIKSAYVYLEGVFDVIFIYVIRRNGESFCYDSDVSIFFFLWMILLFFNLFRLIVTLEKFSLQLSITPLKHDL